MKTPRFLLFSAALALAPAPSLAAPSASEQLAWLDKTTASALLELSIRVQTPADAKSGEKDHTLVYPASLLVARPGLFRLVLDPGGKQEFRAVGDGELVRWLDLATGLFGKAKPGEIADPLALALLTAAGDLGRLTETEELSGAKDSPVQAVRLRPRVYGSGVELATAWLREGRPTGLALELADGRRVFVAVLGFKHNLKTAPSDFEL